MSSPLPAAARTKLAHLAQIADDADALHRALHQKIQLIESRCTEIAGSLRTSGDPDYLRERAALLESLRDEHTTLTAERAARDAFRRRARQVFLCARDWVERQRSDSKWRAVATKAKEYSAGALAQVRQKIFDLTAELTQIATAPLDRASIEAAVERRVAELAASCRVRLTGERGNAPFTIELEGTERGLHRPFALELLAWINPTALSERLLAEIPVTDGMSVADKAAATERLRAELLSTERHEEALIEAAHAAGTTVERRPDADPRAVLGVTIVEADSEQKLRVVA